MIRRNLFLGAALAALLVGNLPAPQAAADVPPLLREQAVVADTSIRLGDLFANVADGSRIVAAAPTPGSRTVFDADQLAAIAAANGVAWQPRSRFDRVTVERESRMLDGHEIERALAAAILAESGRVEFDVEIESRQLSIHVPLDAGTDPKVENLRLDSRARRVTATLLIPGDDGATNRVPVTARLHPVVDVPVLRGPVMPGRAITEADLEWASVRSDRLRRDMITDARWMIGMTPRRAITPGTPVAMRELQERIVVSKNSMVTVVLRSGSLTLTTRGRALDDGAQGAAIRVLNPRSDRVVEAMVVAPDTVEVQSAPFGAPRQQAAVTTDIQARSFR